MLKLALLFAILDALELLIVGFFAKNDLPYAYRQPIHIGKIILIAYCVHVNREILSYSKAFTMATISAMAYTVFHLLIAETYMPGLKKDIVFFSYDNLIAYCMIITFRLLTLFVLSACVIFIKPRWLTALKRFLADKL